MGDRCPGPTMGSGVPTPKGAHLLTRGGPRDRLLGCAVRRRGGVLGSKGGMLVVAIKILQLILEGEGVGDLLSAFRVEVGVSGIAVDNSGGGLGF